MKRAYPILLVAVVVGCASEPPRPIATDGPNQVVLYVPSMT